MVHLLPYRCATCGDRDIMAVIPGREIKLRDGRVRLVKDKAYCLRHWPRSWVAVRQKPERKR